MSLDAGRAVGVADLVGGEGEAAEALAEGHHLGDRHHVLAGAAQDHHVGVVDHAPRAHAPDVGDRVGEEALALEAAEARVALEEEQPRVAHDQRGDLHGLVHAADRGVEGRGVVLHLLARLEVVVPRRRLHGLADPCALEPGGQRRVAEVGAQLGELLVDADPVAVAAGEQVEDLVAERVRLLVPLELRDLAVARDEDPLDRGARELERPRDGAHRAALTAELQDRLSDVLLEHR